MGKENFEISAFKIGKEGWPSLACHDGRSVFGVGEANMEVAMEELTGHSYSSFLVLPWSNRAPVLRSFT